VRNGSVIDLQIGHCEIKALVSGSAIYQVAIGIAAMPAARWRALRADCAGRIDSLVELLQGRLSQGVMERMCRQGAGLFPKPSEIRFACTCEDHASMCKHVAATLYGVGARLDEQPELLFRLRGVDEGDLLADLDGAVPASRSAGARLCSVSIWRDRRMRVAARCVLLPVALRPPPGPGRNKQGEAVPCRRTRPRRQRRPS